MACIQFVSSDGSDANDGLTWKSAKATVPAALLRLEEKAGVVYVGCGSFALPDQGVTLRDGQSLMGMGAKATVLTYKGTGHGVLIGSGTYRTGADLLSNIRLADLGIDGTGAGQAGVELNGVVHFVLERVWVNNFPNGSGIFCHDYCTTGSIRDCRATNSQCGLRALKSLATMSGGGNIASFNAIYVTGGEYQANDFGVLIGDRTVKEESLVVGTGSWFHGVTIEGNRWGGLWNVSATTLNVVDCYFEENGCFAVRIGSTDGNTIRPRMCRCVGNVVGGNNRVAFQVLRGQNIVIAQNNIGGKIDTVYDVGADADLTQIMENFYEAGAITKEISDSGTRTRYTKPS